MISKVESFVRGDQASALVTSRPIQTNFDLLPGATELCRAPSDARLDDIDLGGGSP
jgi:hypothetical protein